MDLTKIEIRLDQHETRIKNLEKYRLKRTPFKCPVCNGYSRILTEAATVDFDGMLRAGLPTSKDCHACDGKGIVWNE